MTGPLPVRGKPQSGTARRGILIDAKCLFALAVMRIGLTLAGYAAIRRRIPDASPSAEGHFYARQLARRIERLALLVPGASCLTQALALQWLLARAGHASELNVGVRRDEGGAFRAHAWISCNGRVVLGHRTTPLAGYTKITARP